MSRIIVLILLFLVLCVRPIQAQNSNFVNPINASPSSTASDSGDAKKQEKDVTKPEKNEEKKAILKLFQDRKADSPQWHNFMAFAVQYAVRTGVPANTIMLILLLPLLATIVAFVRHIIGLPSIGMLVPIALSITLLATGITIGFVLLTIIVFATTLARILLKKVRIQQLPKIALSLWVVSLVVFIALTASASIGTLSVTQISIFPIMIFIILSERIVAVQLERSMRETLIIITVTIGLGILGFLLLSFLPLQNSILLYPELILLLVPINIAIGRYFGLRVTEYFRFSKVLYHGSK